MQIWDTAGQERFQSLIKSYYRSVDCVFFVYDVSNSSTFENIEAWISVFNENNNNPNVIRYLVGNKCDFESRSGYSEKNVLLEKNVYSSFAALGKSRVITKDQGERLATRLNVLFAETSSKYDIGVSSLFINATKRAFPYINRTYITDNKISVLLPEENPSSCTC